MYNLVCINYNYLRFIYEGLHKLVLNLNNRINSACNTSTGEIPILHLEKEKILIWTAWGTDKKSLQNNHHKC